MSPSVHHAKVNTSGTNEPPPRTHTQCHPSIRRAHTPSGNNGSARLQNCLLQEAINRRERLPAKGKPSGSGHSKVQTPPQTIVSLRPTTMVTAASAAAVVDLCLAFIALYIFAFLDPQQLGADPITAQAALLLDGAVELLLPLAALSALFAAVAVIYRHLHHTPANAGAGNRQLWEPFAILCASAATLHLFFFVHPNKPAGVGGGDVGAQARALGLAAARILPAAATATFFLGTTLIIVTHIRAGGEGGGGSFAAADGQIQQGPVLFLTKAAYAAAAVLACLIAMALCICGDTAIY